MFDIAGPLVSYSLLRSAGQSPVPALVLSGACPAFGVTAGLARHRRLDAIGTLVLAGIAIGMILGLATGDAGWCSWKARCPPRFSAWCAWARCGRADRICTPILAGAAL